MILARAFLGRGATIFLFCGCLLASQNSSGGATISGGLQFDGADDYVTFGSALGLGASNFTLECWFKRTGTGATANSGSGGIDAWPLITKGRGEGDGGNVDCNYFFGITGSSNVLGADFEEGATGASPGLNHPVVGLTTISNNIWYHGVVTFDGTNWALYLNGALERQLFVGQPPRWDSIQHAALGTALNSLGQSQGAFAGILDEARIWNYARSASQISSNKNLQIVSAPGLVGRWSLDEGAGTTATNTGSTNINGTLVNGPVWVTGYPFADAPSVSITNPPGGSTFGVPTNIAVNATASDTDGTVTNVAFFFGSTKLGDITNAPYSLTWSNPPLGSFTLTAIVTDNSGLATTSAAVTVTITNAIVQLTSPTNGAHFVTPVDVQLTANASDANGVITLVEFFAGTNRLGSAASRPFAFSWSDAPPGTFALTAISTAANGVISTSAPVSITISNNAAPSVALTQPANNQTFYVPSNVVLIATASDSDGTVAKVEFFQGTTKLGQVLVAPYTFTWTNPAVGVYALQAVATDNFGAASTSAVINIVVANASVTRGPYLQIGTPTSAVVRWRTSVATDARVTFGTNANALTDFAGDTTVTNEHIVTLTNLQPNTRYYYSVGTSNGPIVLNTNFWFVTSPIIGSNKATHIWVLGDPGTGTANQKAVRDAYYNYSTNQLTDLILMLGDNVYENGTDTEFQNNLFDIYPTALRNTFLWPTIGNHDTAQQTSISTFPYLDIFSLPQNAEAGGMPSGTERYFSFNYANIHFVCLDSMTSSRAVNGPMLTWLQSDLAANTQAWTIAFWHHPPYSKGSGHDSDTEQAMVEMRANAMPILEAAGVDLTLTGHSHSYERSFLMSGNYGSSFTFNRNNQNDAGDGRESGTGAYQKPGRAGAVNVVAGSSGQVAAGPLNHPAMYISLAVLGSMVLDVKSNRLEAIFLNSTGGIQDRFTIIKSPSQTSPPATTTNFIASAATNRIVLSWANNSTNEAGFVLESSLDGNSFTALATLGANLTNYTNSGLLAATPYYYRLRATNDAGASAWATLATATLGGPTTPATFAATVTSTNQITLSWANTASNATGLRIERSLDGASFSPLASLATNVASYADNGLLYSTTYYYRIRATNNLGASAWSPVAGATLGAAPVYLDTSVTNFPYQGVTYVVRTNTGYGDGVDAAGTPGIRTVVMHVMVIDLATPGLQFRLTPQAGTNDTQRQTTFNFCTQQVAQVVVNTHFFLPVTSELDVVLAGLAASDGNVYSPFKSQPIAYNKTPSNPAGITLADQSYAIVDYAPALNISSNNGVSIITRNTSFADNKHINEPVTLHNALAGNFQIISNGVKRFPPYVTGGHGFNALNPGAGGTTYSASNPYYAATDKPPRARTAIGYTADNKLVIFTVDENGGGNGSVSQGAKITEIAETLLTDYHCTNALNCDGGSSTTLVLQSPTDRVTRIVNQSSDSPAGRAEGANLAVFAAPYAVIAQQPISRMDNAGNTATFSVTPRVAPASYQWFKDGAALAGQTNATLAVANVQSSNSGNYTVVVSGNYYGSQTSAVATLTINHLPVPSAATLARYPFGGIKVRATNLLGSDADGDGLSLSAINTNSAQGGLVRTNGAWVFYTPPAGFTNADSFGYTVSDGRGGISGGTTAVSVQADQSPPANVIQENLGNGSVKLRFLGIPQRSYVIQFSSSLSSPNWKMLGTATADAFGAFEFTDQPPTGLTGRFYRSAEPEIP